MNLNDDEVTALRAVLNYLRDDERKHYESEPIPGHIYESIQILDTALERRD